MARASSKSRTEFSLYLLGSFRLETRQGGKARAIPLPRRKVETLLAHLALFPNSEIHTREKLAALFWGDSSDAQARTSLRTGLGVIRKVLGEDALITDRERIELNSDFPLWVDSREFERACKSSPDHALELYAGDLLPNFYDDWVLAERERLHGLYIETLQRLARQMRSQSDYEPALAYARQILAVDPANEAAHQHAMFCEMARGNRAAALERYDACVRALRDELGVEPSPETQGLYHWIKQTHTLTASDAARITNLPIPLTSFVGRKTELAHAKSLLLGSRLLTLTGAGGSGKTRLSVQVSMDVMDQFRNGVWWVELAHLNDPALVLNAVAKALGISEKPKQPLRETIVQFLREKTSLLVLDNCEHLIAACAELAHAILTECPSVKILATSREPLGVTGEIVWHVPTLSVPAEIPTREQLLMAYESVRLFVERARAVNSTFALTEQNINAVIQICRRLDGIPLAIELAAARIAALSAQEIAARLDDRFNLLTHGSRTALPRQQTLRALVDWSYDLLSVEERTLFRRLAVFSGGRTLAAVQAVCAFGAINPPQILDLVTRIVTKSLLIPEDSSTDGETRYGFLDTIKHYAREKLDESGETIETRQRHLDYFLEFAETIAPQLTSAQSIRALDQLEREHANFRVALRFAIEQSQLTDALRLCNALTEYWDVRSVLSEGREWLRQTLDASRDEMARSTSQELRTAYAWAQVNAANLATKHGDLGAVAELADTGLRIFRELNDPRGIASALGVQGSLARMQSDWAEANSRFEASLEIARTLGDNRLVGNILRNLGIIAELEGNYARARALLEENLQTSRQAGDPRGIALTLSNLGNIAQQQGDYARAREIYDQVLEIDRAMGARWSVAATLTNIGNLAHSQGDYAAARDYHVQALKIMREIGDKRAIAIVLMNLGNANMVQEDFVTAQKLQNESLRLRRELGDKRGIALTLGNLADIAVGLGKYDEAQIFYAESLGDLLELGDKRTMANCLIGVAQVAVLQHQSERAARLTGGIQALLSTLDAQIDTREQTILDETTRRAREQLGEPGFIAQWEEGKRMTLEQTIRLAIRES